MDNRHCIDLCVETQRVCHVEAMTHCLEVGGDHLEPNHFRLLMNCGDICHAAARFMLSDSPLHAEVCTVCAQVCDACADSCETLEGMESCAKLCRRCAQSCRQMSIAFVPAKLPQAVHFREGVIPVQRPA